MILYIMIPTINSLKSILDEHDPKSILDVGCGDIKIPEGLNLQEYAGLDIETNIISKNRKQFPNLNFLTGDFLQFSQQFHSSFEFVLCFDVLIHQHDYLEYDKFIEGLINSTAKMGLIGGYDKIPDKNHRSEITAYHEPITTTLHKHSINNIKSISIFNQVLFLLFLNKIIMFLMNPIISCLIFQ